MRITKNALIMRHDDHQLELGDCINISGAEAFGTLLATDINGYRRIVGVLNENYVLVEIDVDLPITTPTDIGGGGNNVVIQPVNNATIGYIYHYVPQLKLFAWSRFITPDWLRVQLWLWHS